MSWQDRIREAAYTSPGGVRLTFDFEDVSRTFEKKTTAFEFPDADGTFIQDKGRTGNQYPLRLFFWGDDYDLKASAFEALLSEKGTGKLEHPEYGVASVVPFGAITRRDDLKTAANQAVIEVTFWETIGLSYPTGQSDPGANVLSAVAEFNDAQAQEFGDSVGIDKAVERFNLQSRYLALLATAKSALQPIADFTEAVSRQFSTSSDSAELGIETLVSDPVTLAFQTALLLQAPGRSSALVADKLKAYRDLINAVIEGDGAVVSPGYDDRESNWFHTRRVFVSSYVTGSIISVLNNQFDTKTEAIGAAVELLETFEGVAAWSEANYESLAQVDTGSSYQQLQEAVSLTAGFLVFISFSLKQEKRLVTDRARTFIDLVAELYGELDPQFDFFINSNSLTGDEILEIPAGREVVYYV